MEDSEADIGPPGENMEIEKVNSNLKADEVERKRLEPVVEELSEEEKAWQNNVRQLPQFHELLQANLDEPVIMEIFKLIERGLIVFEDIDEILRKAICRFTKRQGVQFFKVLGQQNFEHIARKSRYMCAQIKIFNYYINNQATIFNGPKQSAVDALLEKTGYNLEVTTGMRRYGGPPPDWDGEPPVHRELSVSKIPSDWYEDKLVPIFSKFGRIYELRIMVDNITGLTRNFCFVKYCDKDENETALCKIDGMEIDEDCRDLKANFSCCNKRLFVGNLPKHETGEGFKQTFSKFVNGIVNCEVFVSEEMFDKGLKNRGFVFLSFDSHEEAAEGKRVLSGIGEQVYDKKMLKVEWCEPAYSPNSEESDKIKAVHVGNLSMDVTEDMLRTKFEAYGKLFHVQKVRDYGFIHFEERDSAFSAIKEADGMELCGYKIKCSLSTSGPMKRKVKRQNEKARLRGEFGYGKRKPRQMPPPPRRPFRGGGGGFRGRDRDHGYGGRDRDHGYGGRDRDRDRRQDRYGGGGDRHRHGGGKRRHDDDGGYGGWGGGYGGWGGGYGGGWGGYGGYGGGGGKMPRY